MTSIPALDFYVTGGTVPRDAPSYIVRQADTALLDGLRAGQFCYVLTSRQMGKSSLMVRMATQLRQEGVTCVILDLTAIGQNLDAERWYGGLLNQLGQQVDLDDELDDFWLAPSPLGPMRRWMQALQQVVLPSCSGNIVIFVDEIDAVRSLPFSADEFFAGIRECYNRRADNASFVRLTFCLLGVATPSDLIRDTRTTPFNIGRRIELTYFTVEEAAALKAGWIANMRAAKQAERLLARTLYWTGGHPYLTQRLCQAIAERIASPLPHNEPALRDLSHATALVDSLCKELFLSSGARERDDNLIFVRERLLRSEVDQASLLDLYGRVRQGKRVANEESNPLVSLLRLSGIVKVTDRFLTVSNRIYAHVFDRKWAHNHMPYAELWRQQAAYRRGVLRTASVSLVILGLTVSLGIMSVWNRHTREASQAARKDAREQTRLRNEAQAATARANQEAQKAVQAQQSEHRERQRADGDRQEALRLRSIADENSREVDLQRQLAEQFKSLFQQRGLLEQARALRLRGGIGQQFESLDLLAQAAKITTKGQMQMELRNEAILCMTRPMDLRPVPGQLWRRDTSGAGCIGLTADGQRGFFTDVKGNVTLRNLSTNRVLLSLPGFGSHADILLSQSGNGRYILVRYNTGRSVVWDLKQRRQIGIYDGFYTWHEIDFSPDSRTMIVLDANTGQNMAAHLYELPSGKEIRRIPVPSGCWSVRFHPSGRKLAFGFQGRNVLVCDLDTGKSETRPTPAQIATLDWSPDGSRLAGASYTSRSIYLWDGKIGSLIAQMTGHVRDVINITFNHRGDLLVSTSFDGTIRFWDGANGAPLMVCHFGCEVPQFSPDDRYFTVSTVPMTQRWELTALYMAPRLQNPDTTSDGRILNLTLHPNGRLLAMASGDLYLWDIETRRLVGRLHSGEYISDAVFSPEGRFLYTCGRDGIRCWNVQSVIEDGREAIQIGPARKLRIGSDDIYWGICLGRQGKTLAAIHNRNHVDVMEAAEGNGQRATGAAPRLEAVAISPDGRFVAGGQWGINNVFVWDAKTGRQLAELPTSLQTNVAFSPDGRWLATGSVEDIQFWSVSDWRRGFHLKRQNPTSWGALAFSPDGRLFAAAISNNEIWLGDPVTGQQYAMLELPDPVNAWRLYFSADGSTLCTVGENMAQVWDLRRIRHRLAEMGLDWQAKSIPPPQTSPPLQPGARPLSIRIVPGETETPAARTALVNMQNSQIRRGTLNLERTLKVRPMTAWSSPTYRAFAWNGLIVEMRSPASAVPVADGESLRVDVLKAAPERWRVKVYSAFFRTAANIFHIHFRARADRNLTATVATEIDLGDYHNTGLDRQLALSPEWKEFDITTRLNNAAESNRAPVFMLGSQLGSTWLRDLKVTAEFAEPPGQLPPRPGNGVIYVGANVSPNYEMGVATSQGLADWVTDESGAMTCAYPAGQQWGNVSFRTVKAPCNDYSANTDLVLDLKGAQGGETVTVGVKTDLDPNNGQEPVYRISNLTTQWQTFRVPLARLVQDPAHPVSRFQHLSVVTQLNFGPNAPETLSFRNIHYER